MKKIELVYRNILYRYMEKKERRFTQSELSKNIGISLSTVNHALRSLKNMGAIRVKLKGFEVINARKILFYWASIRNLERDIIYKTRASKSVIEIEKAMPSNVVFGAYSSYKFIFKQVPADYSEVYIYSKELEEIKKRFPPNSNVPNLFVLKRDFSEMCLAHLFVDLWNMKEWYAKDFLKELEEKINGLLA